MIKLLHDCFQAFSHDLQHQLQISPALGPALMIFALLALIAFFLITPIIQKKWGKRSAPAFSWYIFGFPLCFLVVIVAFMYLFAPSSKDDKKS